MCLPRTALTKRWAILASSVFVSPRAHAGADERA